MPIELKKERFALSGTACDLSGQVLSDADIIVPDVKPDIVRLLQVSATPYITTTQPALDGLAVSGNLDIDIIYLDESGGVHAISSHQPFARNIESGSMPENAIVDAFPMLESLEHKMVNSRKLNVKSLIGIDACITSAHELELPIGLQNAGHYEIKTQPVNAYAMKGHADHEFTVKETVAVPAGQAAIDEVLKISIKPIKKEYKIASNKVIAKGALDVSVLYLTDTDEKSIAHISEEISFTEVVEVPGGADDDVCDLDYTIKSVNFSMREDSDGDLRVVMLEVVLSLKTRLYRAFESEVLVDAYSPSAKVEIAHKNAVLDQLITTTNNQLSLKETTSINRDMPEIAQIYNVTALPKLSGTKIEANKITISGTLDTDIMYLSNDMKNPICQTTFQCPFNHFLDVPGANDSMLCDVSLTVDNIGYTTSMGYEVELRYLLSVDLRVIKPNNLVYIDEIIESELPEKTTPQTYAIKIYFVQKGDTLWDIAKHYHIRLDDLLSVNNIPDPNLILPGQQIIIPQFN